MCILNWNIQNWNIWYKRNPRKIFIKLVQCPYSCSIIIFIMSFTWYKWLVLNLISLFTQRNISNTCTCTNIIIICSWYKSFLNLWINRRHTILSVSQFLHPSPYQFQCRFLSNFIHLHSVPYSSLVHVLVISFFRERYRDLIEAADTITEMKNSAQNVWYMLSLFDFSSHQVKA